METWRQDVRYGLRSLRRSPGFTALAVLVLAAGIGSTTTVFSGVRAVLLAPLPFEGTDGLVALWERNPDFGWEQAQAAPANVLDWRERVAAFADVAAYRDGSMGNVTWMSDGEPRRLDVVEVTGNLFDVLGVRPILGANPTFADTWSPAGPWVVVSHAFWVESLGSDPDVVGRTLDLGGTLVPVRAVLPPGVRFPHPDVDLWTSYGWAPDFVGQDWFRRAHFVAPVARLAPGVTPERARAELEAVALELQREHPALNTNMFAGLTPFREWLVGDLGRPLRILMAGVSVLLLLACANVGTLFLVRAVGRSGELAVRRAVGAGTGRLVGQLVVEAALIGCAGGAVGLALSVVGVEALRAVRPLGVGGVTELSLDGSVLGFGILVSLGSALLFGVLPSLRAVRSAPASELAGTRGRAGGGPGTRGGMGQRMLPLQTGLAVVLVLAAALVTRSFARLQAEDAGIDPAGVWSFSLSIPEGPYPGRDAVLGFFDGVVEGLEALPQVRRAAVTSGIPLTHAGWTSQLVARDWAPGRVAFEVRHRAATPGYFEVLGVPLLAGRGFQPGDGLDGNRVALVNRAFAETHFAGQDPVGREVTFDREPTENSVWRTVVGVVGDERQRTLSLPSDPEVWEPFPQDWGRTRTVVVAWEGDDEGMREALAGAVRAVDPGVPVADLTSMDDVVAASSADAAFLATLFGLFAVLALGLAAVGIYGVTAQVVRRRIPEFGVRLALGAERGAVVGLVLRRVLVLAGGGVVVGAAVGLAAAGLLETLLYRTAVRDGVSFTVAPLLLLGVALLSAWWPARRAARVDPVRSLRAE